MLCFLASCLWIPVDEGTRSAETDERDADTDEFGDSDDDDENGDHDGDGHSSQPDGGDDCDDADPEVHPEAAEVCGDGVDQDCSGDATGCRPWGSHALGDADAVITGREDDEAFGMLVALADVEGDGEQEIVASGGWHADGGIHMIDGSTRGVADSASGNRLTGFWTTALAAGDLDVDGDDELIASDGSQLVVLTGEWDGSTVNEAKTAYATHGSSSATILAALDATGDDAPDAVLGGTFQSTCTVLVYPLVAGALPSWPPGRITGQTYQHCGSAIGGGDFDGDGTGDLVVGAYGVGDGTNFSGAAYIFLGPLADDAILDDADGAVVGASETDALGGAVAAEDLDDDGAIDLLLGVANANAAFVISGMPGAATSTDDAAVRIDGAGGRVGWRVATVDADGDGAADAVVTDTSGFGTAYIVRGPIRASVDLHVADATLSGGGLDHEAGSSVAAGDVDGDGAGDLLIGAYGWKDRVGAVYFFLGGPGM